MGLFHKPGETLYDKANRGIYWAYITVASPFVFALIVILLANYF